MASPTQAARFAAVSRNVKLVMSRNPEEARKRVILLYKAWWREIPHAKSRVAMLTPVVNAIDYLYKVQQYYLDISVKQGRDKVRELFMKNAHIRDTKTIDLLVIKGRMELEETIQVWKQRPHIMNYFAVDPNNKMNSDFLTKFYDGKT